MSADRPIIRIAIAAGSEKRRRILKKDIESKSGLEVVACTALTEAFLHQLGPAFADVLLVDLVEESEPSPDLFQRLLATKGVPIIFNDKSGDEAIISHTWVERLIDKIASVTLHKLRYDLPLNEEDGYEEETATPASANAANEYSDVAIDFEEEMGIPLLSDYLEEEAIPEIRVQTPQPRATKPEKKPPVHVEIRTPSSVAPARADANKSTATHEKTESGLTRRAGLAPAAGSGAQARQEAKTKSETAGTPAVEASGAYKPERAQTVSSSEEIQSLYPNVQEAKNTAVPEIWVLGASIGGPQSVKRFLASLPEQTGVCFLLAQHIGVNFVDLLADQLERSTPFKVKRATEGAKLLPQQVLVAPADLYLSFHHNGDVQLKVRDKPSIYNPCIDDVLTEVATQFPGANAIIFSGMGDDGARGVQVIAKNGGMVWAQNPESCIISSMPDCARKQKLVSFSGTPELLANQLQSVLKKAGLSVRQGVN